MEYEALYTNVFEVSKQAGQMALQAQASIVNIGKQVEDTTCENAQHKAQKEAKTKLDVCRLTKYASVYINAGYCFVRLHLLPIR